MKAKSVVRTWVILLWGSASLQAASTWSGNPQAYQPATSGRADASLQEIRSRALSGQLTTDDVLRAAATIKAVQENSPAAPAASPAAAPSAQTSDSDPASYKRSRTDFRLPIDDTRDPLSSSARAQLDRILDGFPLRQLFLVQGIQILPPVNDPDRGTLVVRTDGDILTLYGASDLKEAAADGMALLVYESLRGSPLEKEWSRYGDLADFVQAYSAWVDNTRGAFENAQSADQPPEELSKLLFVASLFGDSTGERIVTYDEAPREVAWRVQQGHYGFGPYTFEVYQNQIVRLSRNGALLSGSAADIPSLWTLQGLGN